MTALALLDACARRGVTLAPEGDAIRVRGPRKARDELLPAIRSLKPELLDVLKRPTLPSTTVAVPARVPGTRPPRPSDSPGEQWEANWRGDWVNLFGLRRPVGGPQ